MTKDQSLASRISATANGNANGISYPYDYENARVRDERVTLSTLPLTSQNAARQRGRDVADVRINHDSSHSHLTRAPSTVEPLVLRKHHSRTLLSDFRTPQD